MYGRVSGIKEAVGTKTPAPEDPEDSEGEQGKAQSKTDAQSRRRNAEEQARRREAEVKRQEQAARERAEAQRLRREAEGRNHESVAVQAQPKMPQYSSGARIQLPFEGIALRILHDDKIAIVGGSKGELAAINMETGEVLDQVKAEIPTSPPGGGENKYLGDFFFFLELDDQPNVFRTMSHQGNLKTWTFDGGLKVLQDVELVSPHQQTLNSAIRAAQRRGNWSTWTVYDRELAECFSLSIVEAKLSPNRAVILCLTSLFAVYRCSVCGQLLDGPVILPDAFNIEAANADASEFWAGRGMSGSAGGNTISRYSFAKGPLEYFFAKRPLESAAPRRASFGSHGIFRIGDQALYAGGAMVSQRDFATIEGSEIELFIGHEPTAVLDKGIVLAPMCSMIYVYDSQTLKKVGNPMVGGHESDVRRVSVTHDRRRAVSISRESLCVWDLLQRRPLLGGQHNTEQQTLIHNVIGKYNEHSVTLNGTALYTGYQQAALVNFDQNRVITCSFTDGANLIGITGDDVFDNAQVVALGQRPTKVMLRAPGLLGKVVKREVDAIKYFLKQYRILTETLVPCGEIMLGDPLERFGGRCEPTLSNTVTGDLGNGRLALLSAGHLLIYSTQSRAITQGPIDVSGPDGDSDAGWTFYTQMAVTPDGSKIILRGKGLPIKIYDARTLSLIGAISDGTGNLGLLMPWPDNRHLLFTVKNTVVLADMATKGVVGVLRALDHWGGAPKEITRSCFLANGTYLATSHFNELHLYPLLNGEDPREMTLHGDTIGVLYPTMDGRGILTMSSDGIAKKTDFGFQMQDQGTVTQALIKRARESGIAVPKEH